MKKQKDKVTNKMRDTYVGKMSGNITILSRDLYQFIDILLNYIEYKGDVDDFKIYLDNKEKENKDGKSNK